MNPNIEYFIFTQFKVETKKLTIIVKNMFYLVWKVVK